MDELNTHDKFMWHLMKNIDKEIFDTNGIKLGGIKFKF